MSRALLVIAIALAGCPKPSAEPGDGGTGGGGGTGATVGKQIEFSPPADPDVAALPLPVNDAGVKLLTPGAPAELGLATPTPGPMTALTRCVRWITACAEAKHALDDCAHSVPACQTQTPWSEATACCPQSCFDRYATKRLAGVSERAAVEQAYFDRADNCVPGVSALLAGAHP